MQKKYTATRFPLSIVPIEIPDIFAKAKKEIKEHCEKDPAHLGKGVVSPMKAFQKRFENLNGTINSLRKKIFFGGGVIFEFGFLYQRCLIRIVTALGRILFWVIFEFGFLYQCCLIRIISAAVWNFFQMEYS